MKRPAHLRMLRHVVSAKAGRLVLRTLLDRAYPEEGPGQVWVARSGPDPRAWFRDDLPDNRTLWKNGRFPFDECFVPLDQVEEHKSSIIRKLTAHRIWTQTPEAAHSTITRKESAWHHYDEKIHRVGRAQGKKHELEQKPGADLIGPAMGKWVSHIKETEGDPRGYRSSRSWLRALPDESPLRRPAPEVLPEPPASPAKSGYHPSTEEFFYRRHLLRQWRKLNGLQQWLESFPSGALEFIGEHQFKERKWHLLNLWIRVPEGRPLFSDIPVLAFALASAWCFTGKQDRNLFRTLRRKVRRKRTDILAWLGFPAEKRILKYLQRLEPSKTGISQLLRLRELLHDPLMSQHLTQSPFTLEDHHFYLFGSAPYPGRKLLELMIGDPEHPDADTAGQLYYDTRCMIQDLGGPHSPFFQALPRVRSLRRLREFHDRVSRFSLMERLREEEKANQALRKNGDFEIPLEGNSCVHPLKTVDAVLDEAKEMKHCLHSYLKRIAVGRYFAYSIIHKNERATLGIRRKHAVTAPWEIDQIQGPCNARVSEELREQVREWLKTTKAPPRTPRKTPDDEAQLEFPFSSVWQTGTEARGERSPA